MTYTQNAHTQAAMTPSRALELLREGNQRFQDSRFAERDLRQQMRDTADGQWPYAAVLGCIDSRAPAELVFDQGLGDLFNVRIAGNIVNEDILGSLEFACKAAGAKLIVVLGHQSCGAVMGACDGVELGNLSQMLNKLEPAIAAVKEPEDPGQRTSRNAGFVHAVAVENVRQSRAAVLDRSEVLRAMKAAGQIDVVGAMYDLESGAVEFLDLPGEP